MALAGKGALQELTLADVKCPVCLSILIEPVTMPCSHTLCMPCFVQNVAQTALACPLCRKRISVWVRRSTKAKKLVDKRLWDKIQENFSNLIEARLHDEDDFILEDTDVPKPLVCQPGEIRQEYEALLAQEEQERSLQRTEEELASSRLIQQLQEEEKMKLRERRERQQLLCENDEAVAQQVKEAESIKEQEEQLKLLLLLERDEVIARQIEEEEKKKKQPVILSPVSSRKGSHATSKPTSTPTRGPMDIFIGQKTPRSSSKRIAPRVGYSSGSTSSEINFGSPDRSLSLPDRSARDVNSTPTTSSFSPVRRRSLHASTMDSPRRLNKEKGIDSMATRIGRQLREITSSQSSESESEDIGLSSPTCYKKSGKENVGKSSKLGKVKVKNKESESHRTFSECSPDIDSYCGVKMDYSQDSSYSRLEDSDETDIEDDNVESSSALRRLHDSAKKDERQRASDSKSDLRITELCDNVDARLSEQGKASATVSTHSSDVLIPDEVLETEGSKSDDISSLIKEQQLLEARIQQEEADRLLAEALQRELNQRPQVNRSRGSEDEYSLRDRNPAAKKATPTRSVPSKSTVQSKLSPNQSKKRQSTLMESLKKRQKT
ncbi:E3 ubiquitin-protein ligase rnf168-like isoform X2 [Penaeus chinensis]|uniref:E3 ubiquitin-protein ligase rnf168-like isoform X2 n=1 Tax=Penaeus chinensis TaxID=139456 RepID=UPI001FB7E3FB|nr:E3 ubiquitin-protein ligase rnf168-like isoform X2 [Penaeus chinensis]